MSTRSHHDKPTDEWLLQAYHDLGTARYLFDGGRFSHAAFFAHLATEKALKALHRQRQEGLPPVSHDLHYLAEAADLELPPSLQAHLDALHQADISILALYPDRLDAEDVSPKEDQTRDLLDHAETLLEAIRTRMRTG